MIRFPQFKVKIEFPKAMLDKFRGSEYSEALTKFKSKMNKETLAFWKTLAGEKLESSRNMYKASLSLKEYGNGNGEIRLANPALKLEMGKPSFDMKKGLLRNNAKRSKEGIRYKHVLLNTNRYINFSPASKRGKWVTVTENSPGWKWYEQHMAGDAPVPLNLRKEVAAQVRNEIRPRLAAEFKKAVAK